MLEYRKLLSTVVTNPVTAFPITVDGQFSGPHVPPSNPSGGVVNGQIVGEWSDVTPLGFHSPTTTTDTFTATGSGATAIANSATNSLLYVAIDKGGDELYLMYDYLPEQDPNVVRDVAPGTTVADVSFPITQTNPDGSTKSRVIDVLFQTPSSSSGGGTIAAASSSASGGGTPFIPLPLNVNVKFQDTGTVVPASSLGMTGAAGIGQSALSSTPHLQAELGVPLDIPAGFAVSGGVLPTIGEDGPPVVGSPNPTIPPGSSFGYSPNPAFWGASASQGSAGSVGADPQAGSALFQIGPNGSVTASSVIRIGATLINNNLYLVGGNTNDQVNIQHIGSSNTGSTGIKVSGQLNGMNLNNMMYPQPPATINIVLFNGNDNVNEENNITIPTAVTDGNGNDNIQLGQGNNTIAVGDGNDQIQAGNGNNTVVANTGPGHVNIHLGDGNNSVTVIDTSAGHADIQLGNGNNTIGAGDGQDNIHAGDGNDVVRAGNGNDNIQLGNGNNMVFAGNGNDQIHAGNGMNTIGAGDGNDNVQLGNGNGNVVTLGNGQDNVQIGNGSHETVVVGNGQDNVHLGDGSFDNVTIGTGADNVQIGNGNSNTVFVPMMVNTHTQIKFGNGMMNAIVMMMPGE